MYKLAATTVMLSGVMHAVAVVLGGFASELLPLLVITLVYMLFAFALIKQRRWGAWIVFICMLIGVAGALMETNNNSASPNWAYYAIAILDVATALLLFVVLWKSKTVEPVAHVNL